MAQKKSKSNPEVRQRLRAQIRAQNDAVRRRGQTRQAMQRSGRALPAAGGTGGNSNRARDQRKAMARRVQAGQQATVARAWNRVTAANARQDAIRSQLKMTDGRVRYAPPKGEHYGGQPKLPPSSQRALPQGRPGGALAQRGGALQSSGPRSVQGQPTSRGPRPGGRVVADETPRLPQGRQGGAVSQGQGGGAATSGRVTPVRVSEAPRPQVGGGGGRPSLPGGRAGGALSRVGGAVSRAAAQAPKVGLLGAGLTALALPGAVADVVRQTRRTGAAWNRMVSQQPNRRFNPGPKGTGDGSRSRIGGPMADIRGTGRQVPTTQRQKPQEGPRSAPNQPTPRTGGQSGPAGGPGPRSGGSGGGAPSAPRSTPASSTPRSGGSTPSAETDSWSINFLRARRGLPSLSPKEKPTVKAAADARVGPLSGNFGKDVGYRGKGPDGGDVGSRPITDRGFDTVSDLLKKRRR